MQSTTRRFEDKPARREQVPLWIGLVGPQGGGKTFSALRLATGIRSVTGGEIFGIDTEAKRMTHYAKHFNFRHVNFAAPFGPLDYLAAVEHCVRKGAKTVIIDSMSHEHEGPGGVLELHAAEVERLSREWNVKPAKAQIPAWTRPKQERVRLIRSLVQMQCSFVFCFRAKEKIKPVKGDDVKQMGWMPIAGEEFWYEQTINCLLRPGSRGVPDWQPELEGEKAMVKLPEQFRETFLKRFRGQQLNEEIGAELAKWAAGDASSLGLFAELSGAIAEAATLEALEALMPRLKEIPENKLLPAPEFRELKRLFAERKAALEAEPTEAELEQGEDVGDDQAEHGEAGEGEPQAEQG